MPQERRNLKEEKGNTHKLLMPIKKFLIYLNYGFTLADHYIKYMILCEMVCLGLQYEIALVTICAVLTEEYLNF